VIKPADLTGVNDDLARTLIVMARTIAPCLDSLEDGEGEDDPKPRSEAISILKVIGKSRRRGIKYQQTGPARVEYTVDASAFTAEDRAALRSLCAVSTTAGLPVGSFPKPSRAVSRLFPEEC